MKLALAASLLLVGAVNAQAPLDGDKFKLFRTYEESIPTEVVEDDAEYLGGGFIDGNDLYVVAAAERLTSKLIRVPLTRDGTTGKIIDMNFTAATVVLDIDYLDNGFQNDVATGPGNQVFYSVVPDGDPNPESYYPYEVHHGTFDSATKSFTFNHIITYDTWSGLNIFDPNKNSLGFTGLFGIGFSPSASNIDPGTNYGYMIGTAPFGFWQVGLTGDPNAYNPTVVNTRLLCSLDTQYPGGLAFIPAGSLKDSVMLSDYDNDEVVILELDYTTPDAGTGTTGLCIDSTTDLPQLGTSSPKIETFATGVIDAWGFLFDPQTNDFFTTSWGEGTSAHFEGFPPGVDVQVVLDNIASSIEVIGGAYLAGRRFLTEGSKEYETESKSKANRRRQAFLHGDNDPRLLKKDKVVICHKNKETISVSENALQAHLNHGDTLGPCDDTEPEITIDPVQVEKDVMDALDGLNTGTTTTTADLVVAITQPLEQTLKNPSFTEDVLGGGAGQDFVQNIENVETAVATSIGPDSQAYANLVLQENKDIVSIEFGKLQDLFDILKNVIEG